MFLLTFLHMRRQKSNVNNLQEKLWIKLNPKNNLRRQQSPFCNDFQEFAYRATAASLAPEPRLAARHLSNKVT